MNTKLCRVMLALLLVLVLAACGGGEAADAPPASEGEAEITLPPDEGGEAVGQAAVELPPDEAAEVGAADGTPPLRIVVQPALDALPLHVAQTMNLYLEQGVNVEVVLVSNQAEQEALLLAGQVDGALVDLVRLAALASAGVELRAVAALPAIRPTYTLVIGTASGITTLDGLRGQRILVGRGTLAHFVAEDLLVRAGFTPEQILLEDTPEDAVRAELVRSGQAPAAVLSAPYAALLTQTQAGMVIATDQQGAFVPALLAFRADVITQNSLAVTSVLLALERAAAEIATDAERFRPVMIAAAGLPVDVEQNYPLPALAASTLPTLEQVASVTAWMQRVGLVASPPAYEALIQPALP